MDQIYNHNGILFKWERSKAEKILRSRRITLVHAVQTITDPNAIIKTNDTRWKYIGLSDIGLLTVITEEDETRIVTAWKATATERNKYTHQKHCKE